ncbi:MAG TPA: hypothetical protein VEC57_14725 [Candidatus Limnocylindrales bacterium]|nr:hypothetical protein [Candidatus Limnocylindrales bacterium]
MSTWPAPQPIESAAGRSDFAPLVEHSRFPVSVLDDSCATEGAAHEPISYEDGIAEMEADPLVLVATIVGAVLGYLLSTLFPNGFQALP